MKSPMNKRVRLEKMCAICYVGQVYEAPRLPQGTYCQVSEEKLLELESKYLTYKLRSAALGWVLCTKSEFLNFPKMFFRVVSSGLKHRNGL